MEKLIVWDKKNKKDLQTSINRFNRKVRELQRLEKRSYLPEEIDFNYVKNRIKTKAELQRYVTSLNRFQKKSASELVLNEIGQETTKWEQKELERMLRNAKNIYNKEKLELETKKQGETYSKAQMGSTRYREVKLELERLEKGFKDKKGFEYRRFKSHIKNVGSLDYEMRKAYIYRENYIKVLERDYKGFDKYSELMKKIKSIKNPLQFYNIVKKLDDDNLLDLHYVSDTTLQQSEFYKFVSRI